jgi:hypothetical protein
MLIPFSCHLACEDTGIVFSHDFDSTIEAEIVGLSGGQDIIDVTAVIVDGVNLLTSASNKCRVIGSMIADQAEASEYVRNTLRDEAWVRRQERAA